MHACFEAPCRYRRVLYMRSFSARGARQDYAHGPDFEAEPMCAPLLERRLSCGSSLDENLGAAQKTAGGGLSLSGLSLGDQLAKQIM